MTPRPNTAPDRHHPDNECRTSQARVFQNKLFAEHRFEGRSGVLESCNAHGLATTHGTPFARMLVFGCYAEDLAAYHTHLARGARCPQEQRMTLAGHSAQDTTAKNYEHLSPQYLSAAIAEIHAYFDELSKLTSAHLRYRNDRGSSEPLAA